MRKEEYLINGNFTVILFIDSSMIDPYEGSLFSLIFIIWMYLILSCDNQIDLCLRLFRSNRFIL